MAAAVVSPTANASSLNASGEAPSSNSSLAAVSLAPPAAAPEQAQSGTCFDLFNPCKLSELWGRITENWRTIVMIAGAAIAIAAAVAVFFVGISFWWCIVFLVIAAVALFGAYYMHQIPTFLEQRRQLGIMTENNKAMQENIHRVEEHAKDLRGQVVKAEKTALTLQSTLQTQTKAHETQIAAYEENLGKQKKLQKHLSGETAKVRATNKDLVDTNSRLTEQVGFLTTAAKAVTGFTEQHQKQIDTHTTHNSGLTRAISTLSVVSGLAETHVKETPKVVAELRQLVDDAGRHQQTLDEVRKANDELAKVRATHAEENRRFGEQQAAANKKLEDANKLFEARIKAAAEAEERLKKLHADLQSETTELTKVRSGVTNSTALLVQSAHHIRRSSSALANQLLSPPGAPPPVQPRLPDLLGTPVKRRDGETLSPPDSPPTTDA
jgi:hypothetical protein